MALETLQDLFLNELRDMYHAEKQLVRALPRMAKAADSDELRQAIEKHLGETEGQVERLERVFQSLGQAARGKRCQGMEGILEEGKEILEEDGQEPVIDAAIIAAAQKVEHYEIASYGCLITYADLLGENEASRLLKQNLSEEEATDKALTQLAERSINRAAAAVGAESDEAEE
jgi:ferritin-like metal-binding protein YciE